MIAALVVTVGTFAPATRTNALDRAPQGKGPDVRFGINPWDLARFLGQVPEFVGANVGSLRFDVPWQQIEPRPGQYQWATLDSVVAVSQVNRTAILITLRSLSTWGTRLPMQANDPSYHGASSPTEMPRWEAFVSAMALRYKGRNVAYEIENEPNSAFWGGTMDEYLVLLKATYAAITTSDPQARVVSGALACHCAMNMRNAMVTRRENDSLDAWQKAILATHAFNVIGVHDYYFPDHAINGWTFESYLHHVQDLASAAHCDRCPIWITETGFVSRPQVAGTRIDPGSLDNQARWAKQAYRQAFDRGVERVFWLFLKDHPGAGYFATMGLEEADGTPRPALKALSL